MKYKCLVFDHDDTVVNSTATIHHPCFEEYLALRRPGMTCSLEEYFRHSFDGGFIPLARDHYGMTDADFADEVIFGGNMWKSTFPPFMTASVKSWNGKRQREDLFVWYLTPSIII